MRNVILFTLVGLSLLAVGLVVVVVVAGVVAR